MKKIKKRSLLLFLAAVSALLLAAGWYFLADSFRFHQLSETFFRDSFAEDSLSLHFSLADPAAYGIHPQKISLPCYSAQSQKQRQEADLALYQSLQRLHPARLSGPDADLLTQLLAYLETEQKGWQYPYYEEPLSPNSGMQTQLPLLLAEYAFRSVQDVEDYLDLLSSVPAYFASLAQYEQEKAQAGLFMPDCDVTEVISQCDALFPPAQLQNGTHFLQTTFSSRLQALVENGTLTESRKLALESEHSRLLLTVVSPAYVNLGDALLLLKGQTQETCGLAALPEGKDYYLYLLQHTTGSSRSPEEIRQLLTADFQEKLKRLQQLSRAYQEQTGKEPDYTALTQDFPLQNPAEILTDLQKRMAQDFPSLSTLTDGQAIPCTVRNVDQALEPYTSPAYYMTAPMDDVTHNVIRINRSSTGQGTDLYTTLAHEGYPGHLYQTVFSILSQQQQKISPAKQVLFYGGFVEGWAYYVEMLSYGYAAQALEAQLPAADLLCEMMALERSLQINLYCLLDLSIHYENVPRAQIVKTLEAFGIREESAGYIYDYIRTEPANYLKYYLGYLEILALKKEAASLWNGSFTPMRFHRFLLENGPASFPVLRQKLSAL